MNAQLNTQSAASLEPQALQALMTTVIGEMGAAGNAALIILGEELGLFRALAQTGPATSTQLAAAAGVHERYLREWLSAQAASGFVSYDPQGESFSLTPEQAAVFADETGPAYMAGGFQPLASTFNSLPRLSHAFRTGEGVAWGDHCACLFCGVERFYRTGYQNHLLDEWLPALDGVVAKLERGARVVDIGCGHGAATQILADAFPKSEFVGIDLHPASIAHARRNAGNRANLRFEVAAADTVYGQQFDIAAMFDALHDMGDPVAAARQAREALKPDGTLFLVEPMAGDTLADNLHPVGRLFYAASTAICVPTAMSQPGQRALGAQAGEQRIRAALADAGFAHIRRAAATPFNMVIEARN
jgi:SAM-dependent methyltransferase